MDVGKNKGNFASAYKLSRSNLDRKAQRRERRSVEQKEIRQEHVNKRRNLIDLSPLQEGDSSVSTVSKDQTYIDKTPNKPKDEKAKKGQDRLEQLKKWKEERERKRRQEAANSQKRVFRVSAQVQRQETDLFAKVNVKQHPVKPQPAPAFNHPPQNQVSSKKTAASSNRKHPQVPSSPKKSSTVSSRSLSRDSSKNQSRQPSSNRSREVPATTSKEKPGKKLKAPISKFTRAPVSSRQADVKVETSARVTRQTRNRSGNESQEATSSVPNKVLTDLKENATPSPPDLNLMKVNSTRGNTSLGTSSFAPADFTFDVSAANMSNVTSFTFRPLSPASAAGFLGTNPNTSNVSFLETNPNRSSTPIKNKNSKSGSTTSADQTINNQNCTQTDSTISNMQEETVVQSPEVKERSVRSSRSATRSKATKAMENKKRNASGTSNATQLSEDVEGNKKRSGRSRQTRASTKQTDDSDVELSTAKPEADENDRAVAEGLEDTFQSTVNAEKTIIANEATNNQTENGENEEQSPVINKETRNARRNARRSVASLSDNVEKQNNKSKKNARKSVASVTDLNLTETSLPNIKSVETEEVKSTPKRNARKSVATVAAIDKTEVDSLEEQTVKTEVKNTPRRNARKSIATVAEIDKTEVDSSEEETIHTKKAKHTPRRNTRKSIATVADIDKSEVESSEEQTENTEKAKSTPRRNARKSVVAVADIDKTEIDSSEEQTVDPETDKPTPRSSRKSVLLSNESQEDTSNSEGESVKPKPVTRRRSAISTINSDSDSKENSDIELSGSSAKRRNTRRSVSAAESVSPMQNLTSTPSRELRKGRKSVGLVSESEVIAEVSETPETAADNSVFIEEEKKASLNASALEVGAEDSDKENTGPDGRESASKKSSKRGLDVRTPVATKRKNTRNKSFGGFRLPSDSLVLSSKRSAKRKTLMPRSPEEWIEVLNNSPMVEMSRRKNKLGNMSMPALDFDDVDLDEPNSSTSTSELKVNASRSPVAVAEDREVIPVAMDVDEENKENGPPLAPISTDAQPVVQVGEVSSTQNGSSSDESSDEEHDVTYFRKMLCTETNRLNDLNDHWNNINDNTNLTEEIRGQIRTTVGQSKLLMDQRFKQFLGLVDNCEFKTGENETTCTDLEGFWEMVYFQVEDVDKKFADLKKLQQNNWVVEKPEAGVKRTKKSAKPLVKKPVGKSKFAAFRAQMKKTTNDSTSSEPKSSDEEKVFEVPGFFRVASPVRSPKPHCEAGTPKKSTPCVSHSAEQEKTKKLELQIPCSSNILTQRTPSRKSYLPAVPSPLLTDSTPLPRPSRSCTRKTPIPKRIIDDVDAPEPVSESKRSKSTTPRRSLRSRKSVNFSEVVDIHADENLSPKAEVLDPDFARLLQPMDVTQSTDDSIDILDVSLSKYIQPMDVLHKEDSPKQHRRRRSSLKGCRSTERRRSRQRSVHFVSPSGHEMHHAQLPHTPFNRNSLVKQKRVTRQSVEPDDIFSIDNIDNDENVPPPMFRSPRPSLLGTPPDMKKRPSQAVSSVPTATLISFTP